MKRRDLRTGQFANNGGKTAERRDKHCPDCQNYIMRKSTKCHSCSQRVIRKPDDAMSYSGLHWWIRRNFTRTICQSCKITNGQEWANVSGQYMRKREDWLCLCIPCHRRYDTKDHRGYAVGKYPELKKWYKGAKYV